MPTAEKYGEHHVAMYGNESASVMLAGMAVMAVSIVLFV